MGLEEVKKGLERELEQKRKALLKEADEEAELAMKAAKEEVASYKATVKKKTEAEIESITKKNIAAAKLTQKKALLTAKKELIDEVFQGAMEQFSQLSESKRKALIESLINKAEKEIDVETVFVSDQDKNLVKGAKVLTGEMAGGVICESKDGTRRIDLTIERILENVREAHLKEVADTLF